MSLTWMFMRMFIMTSLVMKLSRCVTSLQPSSVSCSSIHHSGRHMPSNLCTQSCAVIYIIQDKNCNPAFYMCVNNIDKPRPQKASTKAPTTPCQVPSAHLHDTDDGLVGLW
jgi:hypothetical protein